MHGPLCNKTGLVRSALLGLSYRHTKRRTKSSRTGRLLLQSDRLTVSLGPKCAKRTASRVEHIFATMKLQFGSARRASGGLAKNLHRLQTTCALLNLCTARKPLLEGLAQSRA